jgi:hypothetical protein
MKKLMLITSMLTLGLMSVGCSKSNSSSGTTANPTAVGGPAPIIIDPTTPDGTEDPIVFESGATTPFEASLDKMRAYTATAGNLLAINNPTNLQININLAQSEAGRYGGTVTISYLDNGVQHEGVFSAGMGKNQRFSGMYDNDELEAKYNYWFTFENQLVFTGFFEDPFGAIVLNLTPDGVVGGGNDAEPLNVKYKGQVYFRNFKTEKTTPYRACWFIYTGLDGHDCRSNVIQSKLGLAPGDGAGYTLLGTFTNVEIKQAFNMN